MYEEGGKAVMIWREFLGHTKHYMLYTCVTCMTHFVGPVDESSLQKFSWRIYIIFCTSLNNCKIMWQQHIDFWLSVIGNFLPKIIKAFNVVSREFYESGLVIISSSVLFDSIKCHLIFYHTYYKCHIYHWSDISTDEICVTRCTNIFLQSFPERYYGTEFW